MVMAAISAVLQMMEPMAGNRGGRGNHHLRQGRTDGDHRRADQNIGNMKAAGESRRAVNEPVTCLDQQQQSDSE